MAKKTKNSNLSIEERLEQTVVPNWDYPYIIPQNWAFFWFSKLIDIEGGTQPPKSQFVDCELEGYVRLVQIRDFSSDKYIVFVPDNNKLRHFNESDILIARYGASLGKICTGLKGAYNVALAKTIFSEEVLNRKYVYWMLHSEAFQNPLTSISRTAQVGFNKDDLSRFAMPLPPLAEQQRIVDHIESLFAKLDEANEKAQEVVDGFETRKAAILHKAFSGELTAKWRTIHSDKIGEIDTTPLDKNFDNYDLPYTLPKSWRWVRFNECCTFVGSGITPKGGKEVYQLHGVPFIRSQNVLKGALDLSDVAYISLEIDNLMKRTRILGGETLFNITGASIGRSCFVPVSQTIGNVNQHVCIIRYKNYIKPELPQFWLNSPYVQAFVVENQVGQTRQALNFKQIRGMYYPLAPISEQTEMVHILENLLAKEQQAKESAKAVIEQIDTIKKAILARAFRGELGTNDPSEESAVDLLKKVLVGDIATQVSTKKPTKRISIPSDIKELLSNIREEEIIKLLLKSAPQSVSINEIMSLSSKKFELMDALRTLEKKQLITKNESSEYSLMR